MNKCFLIIAALWLVWEVPELAQASPTKKVKHIDSVWTSAAASAELIIELKDHLSSKQLELIKSGFATFSRLQLRVVGESGDVIPEIIFKRDCTVRYDLWEESFDIAQIDIHPRVTNTKNIEVFLDQCLLVQLKQSKQLNELAHKGGSIVASLLVDQISVQRADSIKEWLVRQQGGVMKGIFSHLLGELKLSERVDVVVKVRKNFSTKSK
jgi:hypothetical protein